MRKGRLTVAIVLLAVALVLFLHSKKRAADTTAPTQALSTGQPENQSAQKNNDTSGPVPASSSTTASSTSPAPPPAAPENLADRAGAVPPAPAAPSADIPPEIVVQNVRRAIIQFGAMFGGNPVGTNPEITAQLNGGNPKGIKFIDPEAGMRINSNGEMVDSWGTPLFFHQLSAKDTEVRSAGPDKTMWTADDLVAR